MTTHRHRGEHVFECDDCGDLEETGTTSFPEALEHIRSEGWTIRKTPPSQAWEHRCRGCSR